MGTLYDVAEGRLEQPLDAPERTSTAPSTHEVMERICRSNAIFSDDLDCVLDLIKKDETALAEFVLFMAQRSNLRAYKHRKPFLAFEVAQAARAFADRFLSEYADRETDDE